MKTFVVRYGNNKAELTISPENKVDLMVLWDDLILPFEVHPYSWWQKSEDAKRAIGKEPRCGAIETSPSGLLQYTLWVAGLLGLELAKQCARAFAKHGLHCPEQRIIRNKTRRAKKAKRK